MTANLVDLTELDHWWGSDLTTSLSGDLSTVGQGSAGQVTKSNQRVLRRLMTNEGQYIFSQNYGAGVPQQIGENLDVAKERALIVGQMQLEPSVQHSPAPSVQIAAITNGVQVDAAYAVGPEAIPAVLSFTSEA